MIKEVYFTEAKWKPTHDDLGGVSGKIVFKKPVSYQDYLSISRKEYLLLDENKDKEIERLNNIINDLLKRQNEALNYISNFLSMDNRYKHGNGNDELELVRRILNKHNQELKGVDKE